ncbi:MAG TPA: restriction endonuclease subunit S [Opitutaceae bacterium]
MEVKPGYKLTEAGVIPDDWNAERIGSQAEFVTSGSRGWAQFYSDSGALFIRSQNVRDGTLDFEDIQYVSPPAGAEGNRTKVKLNDLLITITGNSVGNVALVKQSFPEAYISQHVGLVRLKEPQRGIYICRYLAPSAPGNPQIAGSQSGQSKPGLNLQNLRDFWIALPPTTEEQRAIAEALNDVDGLLGGVDRLIAKKRDLKQAAMQQLLTGQTRLPGFECEWEETSLGKVADVFKGEGLSKGMVSTVATKPCILYGELFTTYGRIIHSVAGRTDSSEGVLSVSGDVLMPGSTTTTGIDLATASALSLGGVALGGDINIIRRKRDDYSPQFLAYLLTHVKRQTIAELSQGITIHHLYGRDLKRLDLTMPSVPEQTAIAEVLADMDAELAALEQRRAKTRALKQAMMQELLTGRIRLVKPGTAA